MYVFPKKTWFHRNILMNPGFGDTEPLVQKPIFFGWRQILHTRLEVLKFQRNDQLNYIKSPWLTTYLHPFLDGYSLFIPYLSHDIPLSWARLRRKIVAIPSHIPRRCHSKLPQISPRQRSKHWCSCLGMGGLVDFLYIYTYIIIYIYIFNECGKPKHKASPFFIIRAW